MGANIDASDLSLVAAEDLSEKQFYIVSLTSDGEITLADGGADCVIDIGVLQNKPESGYVGTVRYACGKKTKVKLGGTVTIGARATASSGTAIITTTEGARTLGIFTKAGSTGEIGELLLEPGYYPNAG